MIPWAVGGPIKIPIKKKKYFFFWSYRLFRNSLKEEKKDLQAASRTGIGIQCYQDIFSFVLHIPPCFLSIHLSLILFECCLMLSCKLVFPTSPLVTSVSNIHERVICFLFFSSFFFWVWFVFFYSYINPREVI